MKYYIIIILGIALFVLSQNMTFVLDGQEAIAATQQVKTGDSYFVGRTAMNFWSTVKTILPFISGGMIGYAGISLILIKK